MGLRGGPVDWQTEASRRLDAIDGRYFDPVRGRFLDRWPAGEPPLTTLWPLGIVQSAAVLAAAGGAASAAERLARVTAAALGHLDPAHPLLGLDAYPGADDKYFDDNAWIVVNLLDAYAVTGGDRRWLDWARRLDRFVWSGWDDRLGGGLYWRERRECKNTCVNAPATVSALLLHRATGESVYLDRARRLDAWLRASLQDAADGLYFDHRRLDGTLDPTKYPYNTGVMVRAAVHFFEVSGDPAHLAEARRLAEAALARWYDPATGAIAGHAPFVGKMAEGLCHLARVSAEPRWAEPVQRAAAWVRATQHRPDGTYPPDWTARVAAPTGPGELMGDAAAAYLFGLAGSPVPAPRSAPAQRVSGLRRLLSASPAPAPVEPSTVASWLKLGTDGRAYALDLAPDGTLVERVWGEPPSAGWAGTWRADRGELRLNINGCDLAARPDGEGGFGGVERCPVSPSHRLDYRLLPLPGPSAPV